MGLTKSLSQIIDAILFIFGKYQVSIFATSLLHQTISMSLDGTKSSTCYQMITSILEAFPTSSNLEVVYSHISRQFVGNLEAHDVKLLCCFLSLSKSPIESKIIVNGLNGISSIEPECVIYLIDVLLTNKIHVGDVSKIIPNVIAILETSDSVQLNKIVALLTTFNKLGSLKDSRDLLARMDTLKDNAPLGKKAMINVAYSEIFPLES